MYLLDTNVVSELRKASAGRADPNVVAWADGKPLETLFISVITLYELEVGVTRMERRDPVQGAILRGWLEQALRPTFEGRILPVSDDVARRAAALQVPDPAPLPDSLLAATAFSHGLTMVTRNTADFGFADLPLLNPWDSA